MSGRRAFIFAAVLCVSGGSGAAVAQAQTSTAAPPNPPSNICINTLCAPANSPPVSAPAAKGSIKWNPGHYMASDAVMYAGKTMSDVQWEMDDLNNQDAMLGYRAWFTWGALEPTQGNYDFSVIDAMLARLKTAYNKPKRLVIGLWLYGQHGMGANDRRVIPSYIQQNPIYGASPVAGRHGWWGKSSNGASTGMYAPALYYAPVMDRLIALVQALGKHLDSDPYVEAIVVQENSTITEAAAHFPPTDPNYSDAAFSAQLERLLTAATAAFPHTSVVVQNTWFVRPAAGVALEQWMAANRIAPGSPDTWGQSGIATYGTSHLSDGIQTLLGVDQYAGSADLRRTMRPMMEIQSPDIAGPYFAQYGGPWTPLDIINALNQTYQASHAFWTHLTGKEIVFGGPVPSAAIWSNLAATCAAHPLIHTGYPANYP